MPVLSSPARWLRTRASRQPRETPATLPIQEVTSHQVGNADHNSRTVIDFLSFCSGGSIVSATRPP